MAYKHSLNAIDKCLQDLMDNKQPFGGKTVVIGGDFRQCLPVIRKANKIRLLEATVKQSNTWDIFAQYRLTKNMRTINDTSDFSHWLLKLGYGKLNSTNDMVELPDSMILQDNMTIAQYIFGDNISKLSTDDLSHSVILCPINEHCCKINKAIINSLEGTTTTYYSTDSLKTDNENDINNYQTEFLNSIELSGLPKKY